MKFGQIHRIVISAKEQDAINRLESQRDATKAALNELESKRQERMEMQKQTESEIDSFFESMKKVLDYRHRNLKVAFDQLKEAQTAVADEQLIKLQKQQQSIIEALDSQNALVLDTQIDGKKREIKIQEITTNAMQSVDEEAVRIHLQEIVFSRDEKAVSEVMTLFLSFDPKRTGM